MDAGGGADGLTTPADVAATTRRCLLNTSGLRERLTLVTRPAWPPPP